MSLSGSETRTPELAAAFEVQRERLLPCVHCGFCLPACPTYNRLGDEADSPRGRLHLMGAVVEGRLDPGSDAFTTHIDRCLGCRACEPVCPSGVEYGTLLELARDTAAKHRPQGGLTRALLAVMASPGLRSLVFVPGRLLRRTGLAALMVKVLPSYKPFRSVRLGLSMLAASAPWKAPRLRDDEGKEKVGTGDASPPDPARRSSVPAGDVAVLTGCVQQGLFAHVNAATERVLSANGYGLSEAPGQGCCGALHAHGGNLDVARALARENIEAFEAAAVSWIATNTAGCGAAMKEYGTLLEGDDRYRDRAVAFANKVRDVTELLAEVGPMPGARLEYSLAYDHPCHLLHGQRIEQAPLTVLAAIPGVDVRLVERADECCGGAGIYGITHPELGGEIGGDKVAAVMRAGADAACTPNPGCMMQIGAGLRIKGASEQVVHPAELLDESYRRAGYYDAAGIP